MSLPADADLVDWTEYDWSAHVHDVNVANRRLRYVEMGQGPALLLIHGTGGSWTSWLLNLRELATEHRVIAPDVPGFGVSEGPGPSENAAPYADALVGLLDHLGIDRAVLVGHSLGGLIAFRIALSHPERVVGMVCVDGGGVALTPRRLALVTGGLKQMSLLMKREPVTRALIRRPRLRRLVMRNGLHDPHSLTGPMAAAMMSTFAAPGLIDAVSAGARDRAAEEAASIAAPVLLAWGRHDRVLPLHVGEQMAEILPHGTLEVFEESGHCPMLEEPKRFNHVVLQWLSGIGLGGTP